MNVVFAPIGILAVLIVPAVLVGLIILLIKGGPAVRWFFGICLLLIIIGFVGLFSLRVRHVVVHPAYTEAVSSQGATIQTIKDPVVWREGLEEELMPVVYSSPQTAAYGLGVQLQETIAALQKMPSQIVIAENAGDLDIALLEQLRRGLKYVFPDAAIAIAAETSAEVPPAGSIRISLRLQDVREPSIQIPEIQRVDIVEMAQTIPAGNRQGTLQAVVQTADNKYVKQVQFDDRAWLYDPETFRSAVGRGRWAVIASRDTAVTKEQVTEQIEQAAASYLDEQLRQDGMSRSNIQPTDLRSYGFVVDEYFQQLQGLSGPIWRGAMLLEVSPRRLQMLQQGKTAAVSQVRKTWAYRILSLLGMILIISLLYAVVNALTKGYYSIVSAIIAIGCAAIFALFLFLS